MRVYIGEMNNIGAVECSIMKVIKTRPYLEKLKGHRQAILKLYSPKGSTGLTLYSICAAGDLFCWDLNKKEILKHSPIRLTLPNSRHSNKSEPDTQLSCAQFHDNTVYTGHLSGDVVSWNILTGELLCKFSSHNAVVGQIKRVGNRMLITADEVGEVVVWDSVTGDVTNSYLFAGPVTAIESKVPELFVLSNRKTVVCVNLNTRGFVGKRQAEVSKYYVRMLPFQNGLLLQNADFDLEYYENIEDPMLWKIALPNTWVNAVRPIDNYLLCACDDSSLKMVHLEKRKVIDDIKGHTLGINSMEPAGSKLFTASSDCFILSWQPLEITSHIRERNQMWLEDLESRKHEVYMKLMSKKKKKPRGSKGKSKSKLSASRPNNTYSTKR